MSQESPRDRSPLVGAVLTVVVPGLGHWYLGRIRTAVTIVVVIAAVLPLAVAAGLLMGLDAGRVAYAVVGGAWVVRLAAAGHAAWIARAVQFQPTRAHSKLGYVTFVLLASALGFTGSSAMRTFVLEPFKTPSGSGLPTLAEGDHFVVAKLTTRDREARRGDLVVFRHPIQPEETFIKRVVGLPGETITFDQETTVVDGVRFASEPCVQPITPTGPGAACFVEVTPEGVRYQIQIHAPGDEGREPATHVVPEGHVFVVGDNRSRSHDSRDFGPVPLDEIIGRAAAVWLPFDRARTLIPDGAK